MVILLNKNASWEQNEMVAESDSSLVFFPQTEFEQLFMYWPPERKSAMTK